LKIKKRNRRNRLNLSPRRRRLIKILLCGDAKTKKEALNSAGYSESTATKIPHLIIGNSRFQTAMQKALEEQNITEFRLARKIDQGLDATKLISAIVVAPDGEGMKEADSMTKDFIEVPDYFARHKYLETALTLRGDFLEKKVEATLTVETHEQRLARLREKIGKQL